MPRVLFNEMSTERLRAYAQKARDDFKDKIRAGDMQGSLKRAKNVQKAEIRAAFKEDVAANCVGAGKIAGTGVGASGEPSVTKKKNPRLLKDILSRTSK